MSEDETKAILERLRQKRLYLGYKQSYVAYKLGFKSATSIVHIEKAYRGQSLSLRSFLLMCKLYNVSPVWALTGQESESEQ